MRSLTSGWGLWSRLRSSPNWLWIPKSSLFKRQSLLISSISGFVFPVRYPLSRAASCAGARKPRFWARPSWMWAELPPFYFVASSVFPARLSFS